jgi:hypothetical protein
MSNSRCKILVIDKKDKYSGLFKGFRKHKFTITQKLTLLSPSDIEVVDFNIFFIVIYEFKDLVNLLKIHNNGELLILATENLRILKKLKEINKFQTVNLSGEVNITNNFHECFNSILKSRV